MYAAFVVLYHKRSLTDFFSVLYDNFDAAADVYFRIYCK